MAIELASPLVIAGAAVLFVAFERVFPYDRGQRVIREGFWTDLIWYTLIQSYVLALVISAAIRWVDAQTGISRLHLISTWPLPAQLGFFLVTHDLYIYLFRTVYRPQFHPTGYGLQGLFPSGYFAQHLYAFRPFARPGPERAPEEGGYSPV